MILKRNLLFAAALVALATVPAKAVVLISDNFATFSDGTLAGQGGYTAYAASTTSPLQVVGGRVVIPNLTPAATTDNQDVIKSVGTPIVTPGAGTASAFVGMNLRVNTAPLATNSYFFATSDALATGMGVFQNHRITVRPDASGTGFNFGVRVNGQGGNPFAFGGQLPLGSFFSIVAELNLTAGAPNDSVRLFVNPTSTDLASQTPYVTVTAGTGTADVTQIAGVVFSQFASATTGQSGIEITDLRVADNFAQAVVPETSTVALAGLGVLPLALVAIRRRKAA
ncbi:MAG: hypothetical protein H7Y38_01210 [Armatimonadetes bacterium]|nr:hypothetical protein [Armatimonadota bacterium]